jgi:hypothetical protein
LGPESRFLATYESQAEARAVVAEKPTARPAHYDVAYNAQARGLSWFVSIPSQPIRLGVGGAARAAVARQPEGCTTANEGLGDGRSPLPARRGGGSISAHGDGGDERGPLRRRRERRRPRQRQRQRWKLWHRAPIAPKARAVAPDNQQPTESLGQKKRRRQRQRQRQQRRQETPRRWERDGRRQRSRDRTAGTITTKRTTRQPTGVDGNMAARRQWQQRRRRHGRPQKVASAWRPARRINTYVM